MNVDTATWSVFHRWNIINAVLKEGLLVITPLASGDTLERSPMPESEVDSSEKEAEPEVKNTPEVVAESAL